MLGQLILLYFLPAALDSYQGFQYTYPLVLRVFGFVFLGTVSVEAIILFRRKTHSTLSANANRATLRFKTTGSPLTDTPAATADAADGRSSLTPFLGVVALTGIALVAYLEIGSYASQVNAEYRVDLLTQIAKAFSAVQVAAIASALFDLLRQYKSRRAWVFLWLIVIGDGVVSYRVGFLIIVAGSVFTVAVSGLLLGVIRARAVVALFLVALIAMPTAFEVRNAIRSETRAFTTENPLGRLRQDTILAQIQTSSPSGSVQVPDMGEIMRYAIPKFLDTARPPLDVPNQISLATGGSYANSNTFTQPGNIYYLYGGLLVTAFYGFMAGLVALVRSRAKGLLGIVLLVAICSDFLYVGGSFPGTVAGFGQTLFFSLASVCLAEALRRLSSGLNKSIVNTLPLHRPSSIVATSSKPPL